ncbi:catalase [Jannaschia sp. R86511]|uniref:catalase n=1 Tax=Jannaschia sp. R86511 TaxID=3093853 RepID=UPI0036D3DA2D
MSTDQTPATTTTAGAPVHSDEHSMTVGPAGPLLLQDHYLIEKMAQFNRERVPERVVHAKGGGAFGRFTVTNDVSQYTMAKVFQPGAETETLLRFSSVAGEQGSPDTWRDPRGFSLKFYTEDGNYDLVGNNTPVFFVRDPMKFQDFIRSQKRDPQTGLRDHDMQWDFWSLSPESAHQVTWLMGDRGLPKSWRTMNGYGSHTFMWINAEGVRSWVKYHFKTNQGHEFFTQDEGDAMAGQDGDFHRRDLFQAIEDGNYPTWSLKVQIIPFEDAAGYRFNPFDVTKTVSQKDYPLIDVGTLELNRNPANYHVDIEQAAFEPSNFVPGIGPSPDRMLVGRLFSYADAHRYRIGANYNQLPPNAPRAATVNSYSKDGAMRFQHDGDAPVYAPNSRGGAAADPAKAGPMAGWDAAGSMTREAETLHAEDDDFGQARTLLMEVFDDAARERFLTNVTGHLLNAVSEPVLERAFQYWKNVDEGMGTRIENVVRGALAGGDGGAPEPGDGVTGPSDNVNADADEVDVRDRAGMA